MRERAAAAAWTADVLDEEEKAYLRSLPLVATEEEFTLAHGSLRDPAWEYLFSPVAAAAVNQIDDKRGEQRGQAQRQPGSSFKPFIYSASLEKGFTAAAVIVAAARWTNRRFAAGAGSTARLGVGLVALALVLGRPIEAHEFPAQLPALLQSYGAKSDVKAGTIATYNTKGQRLLGDFIKLNGATDQVWFASKQKNEKKSQQTASAASSRFKKSDRAEPQPPADSLPGMIKHPLRLQNKRLAELHVPPPVRAWYHAL